VLMRFTVSSAGCFLARVSALTMVMPAQPHGRLEITFGTSMVALIIYRAGLAERLLQVS
jgi:hypothetical protein